jgi:hypothetical protein
MKSKNSVFRVWDSSENPGRSEKQLLKIILFDEIQFRIKKKAKE